MASSRPGPPVDGTTSATTVASASSFHALDQHPPPSPSSSAIAAIVDSTVMFELKLLSLELDLVSAETPEAEAFTMRKIAACTAALMKARALLTSHSATTALFVRSPPTPVCPTSLIVAQDSNFKNSCLDACPAALPQPDPEQHTQLSLSATSTSLVHSTPTPVCPTSLIVAQDSNVKNSCLDACPAALPQPDPEQQAQLDGPDALPATAPRQHRSKRKGVERDPPLPPPLPILGHAFAPEIAHFLEILSPLLFVPWPTIIDEHPSCQSPFDSFCCYVAIHLFLLVWGAATTTDPSEGIGRYQAGMQAIASTLATITPETIYYIDWAVIDSCFPKVEQFLSPHRSWVHPSAKRPWCLSHFVFRTDSSPTDWDSLCRTPPALLRAQALAFHRQTWTAWPLDDPSDEDHTGATTATTINLLVSMLCRVVFVSLN